MKRLLAKWAKFIGVLIAIFAIAGISAKAAPKAPERSEWGPQQGSEQTDIVYQDWFKVKMPVAANWSLTVNPDDPLHLTLKPKDPAMVGADTRRVLFLYPKRSSAYDTAITRVLDIFYSRKVSAIFEVVYYKTDAELGKKALAYASAEKFDLMFSMGSDSTDFVSANFKGAPVPVVTICSKDPVLLGHMKDYASGSGTNIAYTSLDAPITVHMQYLHQLKPNLKNIAIMYADSNRSAKETQAKPLQESSKQLGINTFNVVVVNNDKAREELVTGMNQALEWMKQTDPEGENSLFWITGSTEVFREIETINKIAGKIPVLSVVPDVVQPGDNSAVLSIGVTFDSNASLAAIYALDILSGRTKPGEMKVGLVSPPDIAINFMKAKQIGLAIPFSFFESASFVYDTEGKLVRKDGLVVKQ